MRALTRAIDRWIFGAYEAAPADLAVYRVLYAAWMLLAVVPEALWVDGAPYAFFSPPVGAAALATGFPPPGTLRALNLLLVVLLGLLLAGWKTPAVSAATGILLLWIKTWAYADGKIDHDILLVLLPLLLAGSGWGRALSVDARRRGVADPDLPRPSWALALAAFVLGLAMFGAGALKGMTGWMDPDVPSTYGHLVANHAGTGRATWLSTHALGWTAPLPWKVADWATTLLECGFLLAMLHPRALRMALALACVFHLGVWLLFDIVFSANVLAYGAFVPWSRLLARRPAGRRLLAFTPTPGRAAAAVATAWIVGGIAVLAGTPVEAALRLQLHELLVIAGAAAGIVYLIRVIVVRQPVPGE